MSGPVSAPSQHEVSEGGPVVNTAAEIDEMIVELSLGDGLNGHDIGISSHISSENPYDPETFNPDQIGQTHPIPLSPSLMAEVKGIARRLALYLTSLAININNTKEHSIIERIANCYKVTQHESNLFTACIEEFAYLTFATEHLPQKILLKSALHNRTILDIYDSLRRENPLGFSSRNLSMYEHEAVIKCFIQVCYNVQFPVSKKVYPMYIGLAHVYNEIVKDIDMSEVKSDDSDGNIAVYIEQEMVEAVVAMLGYSGSELLLESYDQNIHVHGTENTGQSVFCDKCLKKQELDRFKICKRCREHNLRHPHHYCSRDCQVAAWKKHKLFHRQLEKVREQFAPVGKFIITNQ